MNTETKIARLISAAGLAGIGILIMWARWPGRPSTLWQFHEICASPLVQALDPGDCTKQSLAFDGWILLMVIAIGIAISALIGWPHRG